MLLAALLGTALAVCTPLAVQAECLSDADLARVAAAASAALAGKRYAVTTKGSAGPFDFSFAPANCM